jgi:hypothetical protein
MLIDETSEEQVLLFVVIPLILRISHPDLLFPMFMINSFSYLSRHPDLFVS